MTAGQAVNVSEADIESRANNITQPRSVRNKSRQLTDTEIDQK
jgi:hypothetical protein